MRVLLILAIVAIVMTVVVYGAVALIVIGVAHVAVTIGEHRAHRSSVPA